MKTILFLALLLFPALTLAVGPSKIERHTWENGAKGFAATFILTDVKKMPNVFNLELQKCPPHWLPLRWKFSGSSRPRINVLAKSVDEVSYEGKILYPAYHAQCGYAHLLPHKTAELLIYFHPREKEQVVPDVIELVVKSSNKYYYNDKDERVAHLCYFLCLMMEVEKITYNDSDNNVELRVKIDSWNLWPFTKKLVKEMGRDRGLEVEFLYVKEKDELWSEQYRSDQSKSGN